MHLSLWQYYLLAVNAVGFIVSAAYARAAREKGAKAGAALMVLAALGGSVGVLLPILLFDRKAAKENMMARVFIVCVFVLQVVGFLLLRGRHADTFSFAFGAFFRQHRILCVYLGAINLIAFAAYAIDKYNAVRKGRRISIVALLVLAFAGGSIGSLLAMYLFRHKTQKNYFALGVPLILLTQAVVLLYWMNAA